MTVTAAAAAHWLRELHDRVDVGPLAPGALASVDQHAAAVRDILLHGVDDALAAPGAVLLAGYAQGLLASCGSRQTELRVPPRPASGRLTAGGWLELRLRAVCRLADAAWPPPLPR